MLKIRLTRTGKNRHASFRVVVAEHTNPVKGKALELLGSYNPHAKDGEKLVVKADRIKHWIGKGASISPTVNNLLIDQKIIEGKKVQSWKAPKTEGTGDRVQGVGGAKTEAVAEPKTEAKSEEKPAA